MASKEAQIWGHDEYRFHGQRADEHVMIVRNQHPVTLAPVGLGLIISLAIPVFAVVLTDGRATWVALLIYFVIIGWYVGRHLYAYMNSICILTDQRIVNVDQHGFFVRRITEAELTRIQDVSTDVKGLLATMFGFGDVTIRTASKESLLVLRRISNPYDVQQAIVRALKGIKSEG